MGYSFRDDHINEAIRQWSVEDVTRRITVVDPGGPYYLEVDGELLTYGDPTRSDRPSPRVDVIRKAAGDALAEVFA